MKKKISCETAREYIDFVFASMADDYMPPRPDEEKRKHDAALDHMREFKDGHSVIICQECWDYYQQKKREYKGGKNNENST